MELTRGEGVQNPENFADVIYERTPKMRDGMRACLRQCQEHIAALDTATT